MKSFIGSLLYSLLIAIPSLSAEINASTVNERSRKILDYASDNSEPEEEPVAVADNSWPTNDLNNSDCESIDSDMDDPLK